MYSSEKIYSIELGEDFEISTPSKEPRVSIKLKGKKSKRSRSAGDSQAQAERKPPSEGLHFAPLMILTYFLGPFSVHLNPENRGRRFLLTIGMLSGMAGLGMFAGRGFILDIIGRGMPLWPWAAVGAVVILAGFSVWARAAFLVVNHHGQPRHRLPFFLRKPWAVGIVGLIAPGLGLLLAGCARRGAGVIWFGWPIAAAVLLLASSLQVWSLNLEAAGASIPANAFEILLLISIGIVIFGLLGWMVQALEGARQMMGEPGIRSRMRGDWYAAALVCTLVGMAIVWNPPDMARQMDSGAILMQEKGFRVIPLELVRMAHRLDPAPTEYAVHAMELYEQLGRRDEAVRLRQELDANLAPYLALIDNEIRWGSNQSYAGRSPAQEWQILEEMHGQDGIRSYYQAR